MVKLKKWKIFLILLEISIGINASTHWVVTESGRIQPHVSTKSNVNNVGYIKKYKYLSITIIIVIVSHVFKLASTDCFYGISINRAQIDYQLFKLLKTFHHMLTPAFKIN